MKLAEIFKHYITSKEFVVTPQTLRTNIGFFSNHIDPLFGSREIGTIQYIEYQKFANLLLSRGLAPKTVKNIFLVLSGIYRFAIKNDWIDSSKAVDFVELPKFDNRRYFTLNPHLQRSYIRAILSYHEPIYKDIFLFLLHGRRLNEVLSLKWEFLNLNEKILYLPAKQNKSKKNLSFLLTDRLIDVLQSYQVEAELIQGTPFISGYVFINPNTNNRFRDIRKAWHRLLKRAGLPKIRIHDIRHLVATYSINELELPIEKVSHALGHSDIKVTQGYINPKPENARHVIESIFESV
ncbi:MAG: tyrosine-type recombinase/integrase [Sulfurovum sp.]|nr:tyrosine-type recombinase/integrase [Sulfurovum sp.]